jgi:hypothetical protein
MDWAIWGEYERIAVVTIINILAVLFAKDGGVDV